MPPPGLSYVAAQAQIVGPTTTPASGACVASNIGTLASPTLLVNGTNTGICLSTNTSGFLTGDTMYTLQISFSHLAANATIFQIQIGIDVAPSGHSLSVSCYLKTSAAIVTSENATFAIDLTEAGDTSVIQYGVLITEL